MIRIMSMLGAGSTGAALLLAAGFPSAPAASQVASSTPNRCTSLTGMQFGAARVEGAEPFAAGTAIVGGTTVGAKASADLCRVRLRIRPVPGSDIKAEVWLPVSWNRKLMGFGGGGFDGSLNADSGNFLNPAVAHGYASVATDVGHTPAPTPGSWIHKQPERVVDFGHRGTHLAAVAAKQVIAAFYRAPAKRAYFQGCSNGGRDALSLVSRYPADYDAVVAGAPAARYLEVVTQLVTNSRATAGVPQLASKLDLVHKAVLDQCDALDGVTDGLLENPQRCRFDPTVLQCRGADGANCLSSAEVGALQRIYAGPRLRDGTLVMHPPVPGSEGVPGNWGAWVTGPVPAIAGQEFYRWMVYDDPKWVIGGFDLDRDYLVARQRVAPIINADNPDLRAFARRGGKLIIYQGWDDPAITPGSTISYYEAVRRHLGTAADRHVRLFMVPGMAHCGGGPGATSFDMQREIERWDQTGVAPNRIIATKPDVAAGELPLSRPLCAWPMTAHYKGTGSIRDAANFVCRKAG